VKAQESTQAEVGIISVLRDDIRRLLADATRGPCDCEKCVLARRRLRSQAWGHAPLDEVLEVHSD
jgi:hypothetical protein